MLGENLKFGFIGFGKMGKIRHQTLNKMEQCATKVVYEYEGDIATPGNLKRTTTADEYTYAFETIK